MVLHKFIIFFCWRKNFIWCENGGGENFFSANKILYEEKICKHQKKRPPRISYMVLLTKSSFFVWSLINLIGRHINLLRQNNLGED
jgi:hypothetical protein